MNSEAAWTSPSAWCPHPEYWHAEDGHGTELEVSELVGAFVRALQPELVVETGSYTGQTAAVIGKALQQNGHGHLWTLEIDEGLASQARERCTGLPVTVICGDSLTWSPPGSIDFAWIDSGPTQSGTCASTSRYEEISRWLPLFSSQAIIGVHDTAPHHPWLHSLQPLIDGGRIIPITLRTPRGVTFAQVQS